MTGLVIVVAAEESGWLFVSALVQRGLSCLLIFENAESAAAVPTAAAALETLLVGDALNTPEHLSPDVFDQLVRKHPVAVCAGSERGVPLADTLSFRLSLPGNRYPLARARFDKYCMAQAVAAAGLRIPIQYRVATMADIEALPSAEFSWPMILKPALSMGSEGVQRCDDLVALRQAAAALFQTRNRLGRVNEHALVQEYLTGTEYAIDTLSNAGVHRLCAIWEYRKEDERHLGLAPFSSKRLLPANGQVQASLYRYALQVLEAVGIDQGPAHMELVVDEHGVQLMEVAARMHGGQAALHLARQCIAWSQADAWAALCAADVSALAAADAAYTLHRHGEIVLLYCHAAGAQLHSPCWDRLTALPGVISAHMNSMQAAQTHGIVGMLVLAHADAEVLEQSVRQIRALEAQDLYILVSLSMF